MFYGKEDLEIEGKERCTCGCPAYLLGLVITDLPGETSQGIRVATTVSEPVPGAVSAQEGAS